MRNGDAGLIEPFAAPEFFVEGAANCEVRNGNLHITCYRIIDGEKVATVRLITPMVCEAEIRATIVRAFNADEPPGRTLKLIG